MTFLEKIDKRSIGITVGLILPVISLILLWKFQYPEQTFKELLRMGFKTSSYRSIKIFPLLPNLLLFYLTNFRFRIDNFTVGLVVSTIILTLGVIATVLL